MSTEPATGDAPVDASIDARLAALERASDQRSAELRELAAAIPPAISRRALVHGAARDLRAAPNKGEIARRGVRKLVWAPMSLARRVKRRVVGSADADA
ncbi:MAG: hypothetical protein HKN44_00265 [Ilumatobacter sp.]|nr:hypothetical protein [Ilumatobacter sp.]